MAAAVPPPSLLSSFVAAVVLTLAGFLGAKAATSTSSSTTWCVARSDASFQGLQTALDYACFSGADCVPLQSDGLCFLPNTIQAHASYAFNSYYQRKAAAPGSCDFSGTATIAQTDPSYGSCMYPSSLSTAGGASTTPTTTTTTTPTITPVTTSPNAPLMPSPTTMTPTVGTSGVVGGGLTPGATPFIPDNSSEESLLQFMLLTILIPAASFILYWLS